VRRFALIIIIYFYLHYFVEMPIVGLNRDKLFEALGEKFSASLSLTTKRMVSASVLMIFEYV
jgi:hypothetical protein